MANQNRVTVQGFVNKPEAKTSGKGNKYSQWDLAVRTGTNKETGKGTYTYFRCRDMSDRPLPEADKLLEVSGGLTIDVVEKNGKRYTNHGIFVESTAVPEPQERTTEAPGTTEASAGKTPQPDPWDQ